MRKVSRVLAIEMLPKKPGRPQPWKAYLPHNEWSAI